MQHLHEKIIPFVRELGKHTLDKWDELSIATDKGVGDYATDIDVENEKKLHTFLRKLIPGSGFIGEESGKSDVEDAEYVWIVDPIDGTYNYFNQIPLYNIAIALQKGDEMVFGLVYAPASHELFYAYRGKGAYLIRQLYDEEYFEEKTKRLSVSETKKVKESYLYTDFPYSKICKEGDVSKTLTKVFQAGHRVRSFGSAALALCYVAMGAYDAYINLKSAKLHDIAAGVLIIQEAGGLATDFEGNAYTPETIECVVSNGLIHNDLLHALA